MKESMMTKKTKIIKADFSKRGKDLFYLKQELRREQESDISMKILKSLFRIKLRKRGILK